MGGEVSMMAANLSLKANRDSRRQKRKSFYTVQGSYFYERTIYNLPNASPEQLKEIRLRLKTERKLRNLKIYLFVAVITSVIIGVLFYYA